MISGMNLLLEDAIIVLSFRNMFLSIGEIGCRGPSTIFEDVENWLEFLIGTHFHDFGSQPCCTILVQIQPGW